MCVYEWGGPFHSLVFLSSVHIGSDDASHGWQPGIWEARKWRERGGGVQEESYFRAKARRVASWPDRRRRGRREESGAERRGTSEPSSRPSVSVVAGASQEKSLSQAQTSAHSAGS